jgi:hypothetical protein
MPQSLPVVIHHSASLPALVRTFRTSPDLPPDSVPTQPPCPQNFRTKSTGGGGGPPHPAIPTRPLFHFPPFSWIIREVVRGLTAPLSARKFRMGSRGLKPCVAACQVGGLQGFPFQNKLLASRGGWPIPKLGESPNARNHHLAMPHLQEPELLHHEEQEDDHRPPRVLKVLQHLPQAHGTQRDEVTSSP